MTTSPLNALVARVESVEALDAPGRTVGRAVRALIPDGAPKDVLSGAWLGHALHPLMSDIPIGAWTSSVILDWTGGKDRQSASDRLILTGVLAAGATVATGWSDWADAEQGSGAVRRSGLVHAAANATATALMIGSYSARKRGARGRGRLLSLAGSAALGAGGWLGGHLSYTLGAGVTAPRPSGRDAGDGGVRLSVGSVAETASAMTSQYDRPFLSVMLIVSDAAAAVDWYITALGTSVLWDLGGVAGLDLLGAPFFVHEAVPGKAKEVSPTDVGLTTTRIELFVDEPGRFIDRAAEAGATDVEPPTDHEAPWGTHRQGGFTDPFGHRWSVGDRTPLERLTE